MKKIILVILIFPFLAFAEGGVGTNGTGITPFPPGRDATSAGPDQSLSVEAPGGTHSGARATSEGSGVKVCNCTIEPDVLRYANTNPTSGFTPSAPQTTVTPTDEAEQ